MLKIKCRKNNFLEDKNIENHYARPVEKNKIKKRFPVTRSHTSDLKRSAPNQTYKKKNDFCKKIIITTSSNHDWLHPESSENEKDYASGSGNHIIFISYYYFCKHFR